MVDRRFKYKDYDGYDFYANQAAEVVLEEDQRKGLRKEGFGWRRQKRT